MCNHLFRCIWPTFFVMLHIHRQTLRIFERIIPRCWPLYYWWRLEEVWSHPNHCWNRLSTSTWARRWVLLSFFHADPTKIPRPGRCCHSTDRWGHSVSRSAQAAITELCRLVGDVKGAQSSQFWRREVQDQGAGRFGSPKCPLSGLQKAAFLLCPHMVEGPQVWPLPLLVRALTPSWNPHPHDLVHTSPPPDEPTSKHHHTGVRASPCESGGVTYITSLTLKVWGG